jgi:hypothetical protein
MHMHMTIAMDEMSPTWTLLAWLAQAAFDLFVWVLLVILFVAGRHHRRH